MSPNELEENREWRVCKDLEGGGCDLLAGQDQQHWQTKPHIL
jgi:hypothetical protein